MSKIEHINLEFNCIENRNTLEETGNGYNCEKCSKHVVDFTNKSDEELQRIISESFEPVCGIFKRSQLSQKFIRYAAATFIAAASTFTANGQDIVIKDSVDQACNHLEEEHEELGEFFGAVIEVQAEPIGGYEKFFEAISKTIKYPEGLKEKGKVFVQFTVDTHGHMNDFKIIRGYNKMAEQATLKGMANLNFPFKPAEQRGTPVKTRLVIPITFDQEAKEQE